MLRAELANWTARSQDGNRKSSMLLLLALLALSGCSGSGSSESAERTTASPTTGGSSISGSDSGAVSGADFATLSWNPNAESDVAGYRIYYGTAPGTYEQSKGQGVPASEPSYTVTGLVSGARYYFAVTAFDSAGNESDYSPEVYKDIP